MAAIGPSYSSADKGKGAVPLVPAISGQVGQSQESSGKIEEPPPSYGPDQIATIKKKLNITDHQRVEDLNHLQDFHTKILADDSGSMQSGITIRGTNGEEIKTNRWSQLQNSVGNAADILGTFGHGVDVHFFDKSRDIYDLRNSQDPRLAESFNRPPKWRSTPISTKVQSIVEEHAAVSPDVPLNLVIGFDGLPTGDGAGREEHAGLVKLANTMKAASVGGIVVPPGTLHNTITQATGLHASKNEAIILAKDPDTQKPAVYDYSDQKFIHIPTTAEASQSGFGQTSRAHSLALDRNPVLSR